MEQSKVLKYIVMALGISWDIFGMLILSVFIGIGIDQLFHIRPIGILIGCVIGIVSSFRQILKIGGK